MTKRIITTVGTSIFSNVFNASSDVKSYVEGLESLASTEDNYKNTRVDKLKEAIKSNHWTSNFNTSAETASIVKIAEYYKNDEIEVYLLATDTVLSRLAAELVQQWLQHYRQSILVSFLPEQDVIKGLSIHKEQARNFLENGIQNLMRRVLEIQDQGPKGNSLLNISGGYKALIPVLTIMGQLYDFPIYYIYEGSDELIEIQRMPLNFDWEVMELFAAPLLRPDKMTKEEGEELKMLHLVSGEANGKYTLTPLGILIAEYLDRKPPFFGTQFGYFIEYKLKEYYDEQLGCQNVLHGYKPQKYDKNAPPGDVDLVLLDGNGGFTGVEIKPFELLSDSERLKDFMKKLMIRADALGVQKSIKPKQLWLFTYGLQKEKDKKEFPVLGENQINTLAEIAEQMKQSIPGVEFICQYILVTRNKISPGDRIPYKKFLEASIKDEQIKTLYPI